MVEELRLLLMSKCAKETIRRNTGVLQLELSDVYKRQILESISSPQKLPRADRALYALLLTQARHKNYIALGDDSLIKTAVELSLIHILCPREYQFLRSYQ